MITKTTDPLFGQNAEGKTFVIGTKVEYRVFGILLYKKTLHMPESGNVSEYQWFQIQI